MNKGYVLRLRILRRIIKEIREKHRKEILDASKEIEAHRQRCDHLDAFGRSALSGNGQLQTCRICDRQIEKR